MYAPAWDGAKNFDARQPFRVIRHPTSLMLPVPSVGRRAAAALREHDFNTVLFGAAAPLGLLGPVLRRAGATRLVALTHGHEAGWAALPGARGLLRRIGDSVDVVTYLGEYFRSRLARALSTQAAARMVRLAPGVDVAAFRPGPAGPGVGRDPAAAGPGRPPGRGVRVPAGPAQGAGHADSRLARRPRRAPRCAAAARGRRAVRP